MYSAASFATQNPLGGVRSSHWPKYSPSSNSSRSSSCFITRLAYNNKPPHHQVSNGVYNINKESTAKKNVLVPDDQLMNIVTNGASTSSKKLQEGLGIESFLSGKTWLITGATGFVGKVLVEKILRSIPDTKKVYVLIKARDNEDALRRLQTEILEAKIFGVLREAYGKSYNKFMMSKLVAVAGDLTQGPGLGIDSQTARMVTGEIDLMINSAANTTFDERYDVAINTNTKGAIHLTGFADKCKKLKLFLHVSTIYANGGRKGTVTEKPFVNGETTLSADDAVSLDVAAEIEMASTLHHSTTSTKESASLTDELKTLGLQRAKRFGWHDTYTFTKAMGEMMIGECMSGSKVPVVVVRPSIIESTYAYPFPGWIEGNRMLDPIAQNYCKGRMTSFPGDPNSIIDVVPVDMVVNVILAAATRHAANPLVVNGQPSKAVKVYQIGSSGSNPMTLSELFMFYYIHFQDSPILVDGRPLRVTGPLDICSSVQEFSSGLGHAAGRISGEKMRQIAIRMATLYKPYTSFMGRYDCSNTEKLMEEMSDEEKVNFGFDVTQIDWQRYIADVHIPGLRKHVMKERMLAKLLV